MRINDGYTKTVDVGTQGAANAAKTGKANGPHQGHHAGATPSTDAVKVNVSDEARALAAHADAGIDQAKVSRLRDAIDKGTFQVDTHAIANKLVGPAA